MLTEHSTYVTSPTAPAILHFSIQRLPGFMCHLMLLVITLYSVHVLTCGASAANDTQPVYLSLIESGENGFSSLGGVPIN